MKSAILLSVFSTLASVEAIAVNLDALQQTLTTPSRNMLKDVVVDTGIPFRTTLVQVDNTFALPSSEIECNVGGNRQVLTRADVVAALEQALDIYWDDPNVCAPTIANTPIAYPHPYNGIENSQRINFGSNCNWADANRNRDVWVEFPLLAGGEKWCARDGQTSGAGNFRVVFQVSNAGWNQPAPTNVHFCGIIGHQNGYGSPFGICLPRT